MRTQAPASAATRRSVASLLTSLALLVAAVAADAARIGPRDVETRPQPAPHAATIARPEARDATVATRVAEQFGRLGLRFERNEGQFDARARFSARGLGYGFFVTDQGAVLSLTRTVADGDETRTEGQAVRLLMEGAARDVDVVGDGELPGTTNYFIGNDPAKWRTGVRSFERVRVRGVWPGIDVVYYGNGGRLEYDFVVAPGADLSAIRVRLEGTDSMCVDERGDLVMRIGGEELRQMAPVVYQEIDGERHEVAGRYEVRGDLVRFDVGSYDQTAALVIDPVLDYSTYLGGGGGDNGDAIAVDAAGNAYVTGATSSANFPTTMGAFQTMNQGSADVFVTKLAADGQTLVYSTYLGGISLDVGDSIAVDGSGNAYVAGFTSSTNYPTTMGAFQTMNQGSADVFITKLAANGQTLAYSTYLGGSGPDGASGIAVDGSGNAYVTGDTSSTNFPTTMGAFQTVKSTGTDGFVTKFATNGQSLVYSTYFGGDGFEEGESIALDGSGNAYVTGNTTSTNFPTTMGAFQGDQGGRDAFAMKLGATGQSLDYSTYLGGSGGEFGFGIAVDASGNAYVTGNTISTDFPTTMGAFQIMNQGSIDAFISKLAANGQSLVYSTYLGGSSSDQGNGIAVDAAGNAYVTGYTDSTDYPTLDAYQTDQGVRDACVTKLAANGQSIVYSTYLGGSSSEESKGIAIDAAGNAYVTGVTSSTNYPTTMGAYQTNQAGDDVFVTKLRDPMVDPFVTKSGPAAANAGDTITYTIEVGNMRIDDSAPVTVTDVLPAGLINATCSAPDADSCTITMGTVEAVFTTVPGSTTYTIEVMATVDCSVPDQTVLENTASLITMGENSDPSNDTSETVMTTITNAAPMLTCPEEISVGTDKGQCSALVEFKTPVATDDCDTELMVTCDPASGSTFPVGMTTVTCSATDAAGQTGECTFTITVTDMEAPQVTCPKDITVGNDPGQCDAVVDFMASATDNCDAEVSVSCDPASGSFFPVGMTMVTCSATDEAGNTGMCSFTITVDDTEAPAITCPMNITVGNDPGQCGAVVTFMTTATDNCDATPTISCSPASGSFFPVGMTMVSCTATDTAGNSSMCSFTVTVNDVEAPMITCPPDVTVTATGFDGCTLTAVVTYAAPMTSDNCAVASVACVPPSGSTFPEGQTTVTCTVTDTAGNSSQCTFTATVNAPFGVCVIGYDGDTFQQVTDRTSPLWRFWRYRDAQTGKVFCGIANYLSFIPGRSLVSYDTNFSAENRFVMMNANVNLASQSGTVRLVDRADGFRSYELRVQTVLDGVCPLPN